MAHKTVWEASADGTRAAGNGASMSEAPPRPAPGSTPLLGLHHLFVRGWGRVAVGRGWGVGYAPLGGVGLNLESHRHGIHGRVHAGSSGVGVIGQPWRLGSWRRVRGLPGVGHVEGGLLDERRRVHAPPDEEAGSAAEEDAHHEEEPEVPQPLDGERPHTAPGPAAVLVGAAYVVCRVQSFEIPAVLFWPPCT